jgi:hypothetical protein
MDHGSKNFWSPSLLIINYYYYYYYYCGKRSSRPKDEATTVGAQPRLVHFLL